MGSLESLALVMDAVLHGSLECLLVNESVFADGDMNRLLRAVNAAGGERLETMCIRNCVVNASGVEMIAGCLARVPSLYKLRLGANGLGDAGAAAIAAALPRAASIRVLSVDANNIGPLGAVSLASSIAGSQLALLDLSDNPHIGSAAIATLVRNLPRATIQHLNLSGTGMDDLAFAELCAVLPQCPVLSALNVSGNGLTQDSLDCLAGVLRACPRLRDLALDGNNFTTLDSMGDALARGTTSRLDSVFITDNPALEEESVRRFIDRVVHPASPLRHVHLPRHIADETDAALSRRLGSLHSTRNNALIALASPYIFRRLGAHSAMRRCLPMELIRMIGDMLPDDGDRFHWW